MYSELTFVFLVVKQTSELLLNNHDLKLVGSMAFPEARSNNYLAVLEAVKAGLRISLGWMM